MLCIISSCTIFYNKIQFYVTSCCTLLFWILDHTIYNMSHRVRLHYVMLWSLWCVLLSHIIVHFVVLVFSSIRHVAFYYVVELVIFHALMFVSFCTTVC